MRSLLSRFVELPMSARIGMAVVSGGLVVGLAMAFPRYLWLIVIAVAVAGLVVLAFHSFLKWREKKKSKPFEEKLKQQSAGSPSGVSGVEAKARLDDMRRKFEQGVSTFREHGKDIYSLPWYLLVGEPGSGKTEAIRHCNVGFPPGLQDRLQGTGGTVNMHWWFTNYAVVLDTAGRLMFEQVQPGKTNEWREFLKLMRQSRPNCPINGMMLVIPVDSLIEDTADEIHAKGGRIAEQLDVIQKALGVRFPVFVVITKADRISGFRSFFRDLDDPVISQQILGWSNPDDLDAPFRPELVDAHLETVAERLKSKRLGLLMDPVHRDDPMDGKRLDEVDSLYAFPDNLLKIGPRLRQYLEMIFVPGEWSSRPLFLRGIYFTSSMQEGTELDATLAEALGIDVDQLPGGKPWERSSSYFLRDLFMSKVFKERGLVTNATNARQQQRRRRSIVIGTGIAAVLAMIGVTWFSSGSLESSIGSRSDFWEDLAGYVEDKRERDELGILYQSGDGYYWDGAGLPTDDDGRAVTFDGKELTLAQIPLEAKARAQADEESPPITPVPFRPVAWATDSDVFSKQVPASAAVFEQMVLVPVVDAARARMRSMADSREPWDASATAALAELVRLERGEPIRLDPLVRFAAPDSDNPGGIEAADGTSPEDEVAALQEVLDWTYAPGPGGVAWPPEDVRYSDDGREDPLLAGLRGLAGGWERGATGEGGKLTEMRALGDAINAFGEAEQRLLAQAEFRSVQTVAQFRSSRAAWDQLYDGGGGDAARSLVAADAALDAAMTEWIEQQFDNGGASNLIRKASEAILADAGRDRATLLEAMGGEEAELDGRLAAFREGLDAEFGESQEEATASLAEVEAALDGSGAALLALGPGETVRPYERRAGLYEVADGELHSGIELASLGGVRDQLSAVDLTAENARGEVLRLAGTDPEDGSAIGRAAELVRDAVRAARRHRLHLVGDQALAILEAGGGAGASRERMVEIISELVAERAAGRTDDELPYATDKLPFSVVFDADNKPLDPRYHPDAARDMLTAMTNLRVRLVGDGGGDGPLADEPSLGSRFAQVDTAVEAWRDRYETYWGQTVLGGFEMRMPEASDPAAGPWPDVRSELAGIGVDNVNDSLEALAEWGVRALGALPRRSDGSEDPVIEEASKRFASMREALSGAGSGERYERALKETLRAWRSLPAEVAAARSRIGSLQVADFEDVYLGRQARVYSEDPDEPANVEYWDRVVWLALRSLAESSQQSASEDRDFVVAAGRKFPLCRDASDALTLEQLTQVVRVADRLRSGSWSGQGGQTIAGGARIEGWSEANGQLALLGGEGALSADREWFDERLWPVVKLFVDDSGNVSPPAWSPVILPASLNAADRWYQEVRLLDASGNAIVNRRQSGAPRSNSLGTLNSDLTAAWEDLRVPMTPGRGDAFRMEFYTFKITEGEDSDQTPVAEKVVAGPWSLLRLMLGQAAGIERLDEPGYEDVIAVSISVGLGDGAPPYRLGIRFPGRETPDPEQWPSLADWPASGGGR